MFLCIGKFYEIWSQLMVLPVMLKFDAIAKLYYIYVILDWPLLRVEREVNLYQFN